MCVLFPQEMILDQVDGKAVPRYLIYDIIKFEVSDKSTLEAAALSRKAEFWKTILVFGNVYFNQHDQHENSVRNLSFVCWYLIAEFECHLSVRMMYAMLQSGADNQWEHSWCVCVSCWNCAAIQC